MPEKNVYMAVHAELVLTTDELWPDGPPESPSDNDVRDLLQDVGIDEVLSWFMISTHDIDVDVLSEDV